MELFTQLNSVKTQVREQAVPYLGAASITLRHLTAVNRAICPRVTSLMTLIYVGVWIAACTSMPRLLAYWFLPLCLIAYARTYKRFNLDQYLTTLATGSMASKGTQLGIPLVINGVFSILILLMSSHLLIDVLYMPWWSLPMLFAVSTFWIFAFISSFFWLPVFIFFMARRDMRQISNHHLQWFKSRPMPTVRFPDFSHVEHIPYGLENYCALKETFGQEETFGKLMRYIGGPVKYVDNVEITMMNNKFQIHFFTNLGISSMETNNVTDLLAIRACCKEYEWEFAFQFPCEAQFWQLCSLIN